MKLLKEAFSGYRECLFFCYGYFISITFLAKAQSSSKNKRVLTSSLLPKVLFVCQNEKNHAIKYLFSILSVYSLTFCINLADINNNIDNIPTYYYQYEVY